MNYADRGTRLLGQIIDSLVAIAPVLIVGIYARAASDSVAIVLFFAAIGWMFFHLVLADGLAGGQSFGKRVVGTRVVHAESGKPCTFGQSFIRNILLSMLGPIDWIFIFGEKHQRLGDMAAGTVVLKAN